jgi:hypothetical protein
VTVDRATPWRDVEESMTDTEATDAPQKPERPTYKVIFGSDVAQFAAAVEAALNDGYEPRERVLVVNGHFYCDYVKYPDTEVVGLPRYPVEIDNDKYDDRANARLIRQVSRLYDDPAFIELLKKIIRDAKHISETGERAPVPAAADDAGSEVVKVDV